MSVQMMGEPPKAASYERRDDWRAAEGGERMRAAEGGELRSDDVTGEPPQAASPECITHQPPKAVSCMQSANGRAAAGGELQDFR